MGVINWEERPLLRDPVALVAFEGWGDAGESSTGALEHVLDTLDGDLIAWLDPEEFIDFSAQRPTVSINDGGTRRIEWPQLAIWGVEAPADRDLVLVTGPEPNLRWSAFAEAVVEVLTSLQVRRVVLLGAFIGQVPHTLPVPLVGTTSHPELVRSHQLLPSRYEGPTGIVGVLTQRLAAEGFQVVSAWAAVPHYLANQTYPPGMLALLETALDVAEVSIDLADLEEEAADFRRGVDAAIADSADLADYVRNLEEETGADDAGSAASLVEEIERFLRDR
jgi:proteasome assembly chaperone (PAC2) family protein